MINILLKKTAYELRRYFFLLQYPFVKQSLQANLSANMASISIETTNICNANCIFCAYQFQNRPTGIMDQDLYKSIIDQFSDLGGSHVGLTPTVGDPLVDPQILSRIAYARSKANIKSVGMYSNMILLSRVTPEKLIDAGLTSLVVSTSGFNSDMYERIYRSNQFEQVFCNIKQFALMNNRKNKPVDFSIDMRVDKPLAEITNNERFKEIEALIGKNRIGIKFRYDNWGGKITRSNLIGNMKLRNKSLRHPRISPCSEMYNGLMVYWNGKVGACGCRDVNACELIIGDATKQRVKDIWFGQKLQQLRDEFLTSKIKPICYNCTHYSNISSLIPK